MLNIEDCLPLFYMPKLSLRLGSNFRITVTSQAFFFYTLKMYLQEATVNFFF